MIGRIDADRDVRPVFQLPMRPQTVEALVLRTYRYGEADRIVVFLTEDRGKRRGVAKNATKSRRRFGAALEPLTRGLVTFVEREGRELVRVDRIEPSMSPMRAVAGRPIEDGAHVLGTAAYFAELIDEWAPVGSPNERLFRLGASVGEALCAGGGVDRLSRYFEYWLLRLEGVYPGLEACARCHEASLGDGAWLAAAERAFVCDRCGYGGIRLSADALGFLRQARTAPPADLDAMPVTIDGLRELERAHHLLMAMHLERDVRSARVVRELRPTS
jgi:DNA repair protein RecO (recombination protein O)